MQTNAERNRELSKDQAMPLRSTTLVFMTSGLLAMAGISGCQSSGIGFRSMRVASPWQRTQSQPRSPIADEPVESETYVPQLRETQPRLSLPPEPDYPIPTGPQEKPLPVPPALDLETPPASQNPQTRRWAPSRPNTSSDRYSGLSQTSESEENDLPAARVTYDGSHTQTDDPIITPAPEHSSSSQPQLFRPAGSAKNVYEAMKRKLSRSDSSR